MNREQTVKPRILIVENENVTALDMATTLKNAGYDVTSIVASGEEAVNRSLLENPDLVLMDIMLNGKMNGIEAGRIINSEADIPIIYLTAFENHKLPDRTELSSSYGYVSKPFTERELCTNVEIALYKSVLSRKIVRLNKALQVIRKVDRHIARVRDRNLLIRDTCDIFTREKAYNSAWIALPDEAPGTSDHAMLYAGAGVINQDPGGFLRLMEKGNYPFCVSLAHKLPLDKNAIIVSPLNPGDCNCPLHCNDRQGQALTARLILDNNRFGFICVSLPDNTPIGDSEISLFKD
ncbi:MAG: response regulator, partial [bacterium]|nr:response regulator [bacterium]